MLTFAKPILLFSLLFLTFPVAARQHDHRIYSNVVYNQEGGDLLGTELEITLDGQSVEGLLRIYEGGCASPITVDGTLDADRIRLAGTDEAYGKVEIAGVLNSNTLEGNLNLAVAGHADRIVLNRVGKPHCSN